MEVCVHGMNPGRFGQFKAYTLGSGDLKITVIDYGARIISMKYRGRELLMQYPEAEDYIEDGAYAGAIVGRTANRIRDAVCRIGNRPFRLTANLGPHHFHGGRGNFSNRIWTADPDGSGEGLPADRDCETAHTGSERLRLKLLSPDGDNGYPGNLEAAVTYEVDDQSMTILFEAAADRDTLYAPTTHLYFDLENGQDVRAYRLQMDAGTYLKNDGEQFPCGDPEPVSGIWDFRKEKVIGRSFDHCFLLNQNGKARLKAGGICIEIETDFPGIQLYTGNGLSGKLKDHQGIAAEPEFAPDAIHHPSWEQPLLKAGEHFRKYVRYTVAKEDRDNGIDSEGQTVNRT